MELQLSGLLTGGRSRNGKTSREYVSRADGWTGGGESSVVKKLLGGGEELQTQNCHQTKKHFPVECCPYPIQVSTLYFAKNRGVLEESVVYVWAAAAVVSGGGLVVNVERSSSKSLRAELRSFDKINQENEEKRGDEEEGETCWKSRAGHNTPHGV